MALTVNGVTPTKVIVNQNGTDVELTQIDVVKDGNRVTVWTADDPKWIPVITNAYYVYYLYGDYVVMHFDLKSNSGVRSRVKYEADGRMADGRIIDGINLNHTSDPYIIGVDVKGCQFQPTNGGVILDGDISQIYISISLAEYTLSEPKWHTPLNLSIGDFRREEYDDSPETTTTTTTTT